MSSLNALTCFYTQLQGDPTIMHSACTRRTRFSFRDCFALDAFGMHPIIRAHMVRLGLRPQGGQAARQPNTRTPKGQVAAQIGRQDALRHYAFNVLNEDEMLNQFAECNPRDYVLGWNILNVASYHYRQDTKEYQSPDGLTPTLTPAPEFEAGSSKNSPTSPTVPPVQQVLLQVPALSPQEKTQELRSLEALRPRKRTGPSSAGSSQSSSNTLRATQLPGIKERASGRNRGRQECLTPFQEALDQQTKGTANMRQGHNQDSGLLVAVKCKFARLSSLVSSQQPAIVFRHIVPTKRDTKRTRDFYVWGTMM